MNPQPFPWHWLKLTSRATERLMRDARNFFEHHEAESMITRLSEIVRAPVDVRIEAVTHGTPVPRAGWIAVALEHEANRFVVFVDSGLAATAVMRTMKRQPPRVIDPARTPSKALAGAFAAILVAASRAGRRPLRVEWCGDALDISAAAMPAQMMGVHALTIVDDDVHETHLYLSEHFLSASPNSSFTSADLIALGDLPIALRIVASAATAPRREVESLRNGDVWLPETFLTRALTGHFSGDVVLAAPTSDRGVRARLADDGSLVLLEGAEEMTMAGEEDAIVGNTGDAPLVVRVEVGSVTLTAREWSALKAGDVITTKNKISDPVILRVGGIEVARGELVSVDGHIGVRIESRS